MKFTNNYGNGFKGYTLLNYEDIKSTIRNIKEGKYCVVVNKVNGSYELLKSCKSTNKIIIGTVLHKKSIMQTTKAISSIIKEYGRENVSTYTYCVKKFGKKYVDKVEPLCYKKNPHYSCATSMRLYDINMIKYINGL